MLSAASRSPEESGTKTTGRIQTLNLSLDTPVDNSGLTGISGTSRTSGPPGADLPGPDFIGLVLQLGQAVLHVLQVEVEGQLQVLVHVLLLAILERSRGVLVALRRKRRMKELEEGEEGRRGRRGGKRRRGRRRRKWKMMRRKHVSFSCHQQNNQCLTCRKLM